MTKVQTLVLSRAIFPTRKDAAKWCRDRGYVGKLNGSPGSHWMFCQFPAPKGIANSFQTIRITTGVSAVVCVVKEPKALPPAINMGKLDAIGISAPEMFCQLDVELIPLVLRRSDGSTIDSGQRSELLAASRGGEVVELGIDVVGFQQAKDKPKPLPEKMAKLANARFFTFRQSELGRFAKSFTGRPFLRDHDRGDLLKRGGTIVSSELREQRGQLQFHQSVKLVKPWAVEAALDGTLETFSIGWDPSKAGLRGLAESIHCTVCNKAMFSSDCCHMPGEATKVAKSDESVIVEAEFRNPRGAELSGVSFPAVAGTHVESIKSE